MEKILDKIINYGLKLLVFLLPLWFLPLTFYPVGINKQMLLAIFVFLLLISWLIKIIIKGRVGFIWNKLSIAVLFFLLTISVSAAFSSSKIQSFWGMNFEPDTLFNFILYILLFFLFANLIKKEKVLSIISVFLLSSGILALLFLIQIIKPIFPWDFAKTFDFNPIGSVQALAVFLGGAFSVLIATINDNLIFKKRLISGLLGFLLFLAIFLINYFVVWLGIAFVMAILIFKRLKNISIVPQPKHLTNPLRPLFLPVSIFILAMFFVFLKLPIGNIVNLPSEISPNYKATIDIAVKTLQSGPKNFIFGSGPATFGYQYSLHRGAGPNLTDFWQIRFGQGAAVLPTFFTTLGLLGILAILLMIGVFFWQGLRTLIRGDKNTNKAQTSIAIFVGGFYFFLLWFVYSINLSLMFAGFLMMGLWTATGANQQKSAAKEFLFTQSVQKAFFIMLICLILIVGSGLGIYNISKKYAAAIIVTRGLSLTSATESKLDEGIADINKAVALDQKDSYLRNLSQAYLLKTNKVLNNQKLTKEQRQVEFQRQVSNAELSANVAVKINPSNSQNWLQLGSVYENLALLNIEGVENSAVLNYQKAAELDPQNPQIPLNIGRVYKSTKENLEKAIGEFKKSVELKYNFTPAYYLMAQTYETQGKKDEALKNYQIVLKLEPKNEEIRKKIEELNK